MFHHVFRTVTCLSLIVLGVSTASAADLDVYREFKLGATTADVLTLARLPVSNIRTLHERPALLQELTWRPSSSFGRDMSDFDSVRGLTFSFMNDELFKIVIEYDTNRTEGLTREDLITSLSVPYGPRSRLATQSRMPANQQLDAAVVVAQWRDDRTLVALLESDYRGGFSLVITRLAAESKAREALASAVALDNREAPAREAARVKDAAAAAKAAADKTRTTNKSTFEP